MYKFSKLSLILGLFCVSVEQGLTNITALTKPEDLKVRLKICAIAIGDVNNDGRNEIVVGKRDGQINVIRDKRVIFSQNLFKRLRVSQVVKDLRLDGDERELFGMTEKSQIYQHLRCLAIGDADADGKNEIVVGGYWECPLGGTGMSFGRGGGLINIYRLEKGAFCLKWSYMFVGSYVESIAMGDVDGNKLSEIVVAYGCGDFGTWTEELCAYEWNGKAYIKKWASSSWTFAKTREALPSGAETVGLTFKVMVADVDADERKELIVGVVDYHPYDVRWQVAGSRINLEGSMDETSGRRGICYSGDKKQCWFYLMHWRFDDGLLGWNFKPEECWGYLPYWENVHYDNGMLQIGIFRLSKFPLPFVAAIMTVERNDRDNIFCLFRWKPDSGLLDFFARPTKSDLMATGDLDGNGNDDLVLASSGKSTISIFKDIWRLIK